MTPAPKKPTKPAKLALPKLPKPTKLLAKLGKSSTPDPLAGVKYTDDLEKDCKAELTALEKAYRDRAKAEEKRVVDATDSEHWFAVCFRDRAEKEAFLAAIGASVRLHGDKYLRGDDLAALIRLDI